MYGHYKLLKFKKVYNEHALLIPLRKTKQNMLIPRDVLS